MNPSIAQIIIFALSEAVIAYPKLKASIIAVLSKEDATPEDWAKLREEIAANDYFHYVPTSALKK